MKNSILLIIVSLSMLLFSCNQVQNKPEKKVIVRISPKKLSYTLENTKDWLSKNQADSIKLGIIFATNRVDKTTVSQLDSIIVPADFSGDIVYYLPFPLEVKALQDVDKIILFSYPTQTFGAYENGNLVYAGPTSMGRAKDVTPTGLFFTNWKAEKTTSTFNDEWDLKWNFNIENKLGVGFHEYKLPGYPASHSCLRLLEKDAKFLYNWADQWVVNKKEVVTAQGTPVIVFGAYNFDENKPWLQLVKDPKALQLSENDIENQVSPFLSRISKEQKTRLSLDK
ncbi:MAG: L,D-transpeptidase [Flavobacterium sp.]|nr:L,D-transpeptidase [Flavobacterium sp.]